MSNTKQISIRGQVPFDLADNDKVRDKLGQINTPCIGLKITYSSESTGHKPSNHGGQTALYDFWLEGVEAVSTVWLQSFVDDLKATGATITEANVYDIDGEEKINLKI